MVIVRLIRTIDPICPQVILSGVGDVVPFGMLYITIMRLRYRNMRSIPNGTWNTLAKVSLRYDD